MVINSPFHNVRTNEYREAVLMWKNEDWAGLRVMAYGSLPEQPSLTPHLKSESASWWILTHVQASMPQKGTIWLHLFSSPVCFFILRFVTRIGTRHLPAVGQSQQTAIKAAQGQQVCSYKLDPYHVLTFEGHFFINRNSERNGAGGNTPCKQALSCWHFHFFAE